MFIKLVKKGQSICPVSLVSPRPAFRDCAGRCDQSPGRGSSHGRVRYVACRETKWHRPATSCRMARSLGRTTAAASLGNH